MKLSEIRQYCDERHKSVKALEHFHRAASTDMPRLLDAIERKLWEEAEHPQDGMDASMYTCLSDVGILDD